MLGHVTQEMRCGCLKSLWERILGLSLWAQGWKKAVIINVCRARERGEGGTQSVDLLSLAKALPRRCLREGKGSS